MRVLILLVVAPMMVFAQKAKPYSTVTTELSQKIIATQTSGQPVRLAVVPFTSTKSSLETSRSFGEYLTETVIGAIGNHPQKIKLFERTRLDAILKEHEFILTDMLSPAAALKIGQLAPIDGLVSGTYTKLKSYIDVSARVIDVATGEITGTYNGRIKVDKNLAALFNSSAADTAPAQGQATPPVINITVSGNTTTSTPPRSAAEICKQRVEEFKLKLNDLSTPEKINHVAGDAMKTPFDNLCGQLHFHVMYAFTRFKIDNQDYETFLLQTLDTIAYPAGDERALEIVRYLGADGEVNDREWSVGLKATSRVGNYSLSTYLSYLLGKAPLPDDKVARTRIAEYFALASSGKIGLPRAIPFEASFFEIEEGLRGRQSLRQYVYESYSDRLPDDEKTNASIFSLLHALYKEETAPEKKTVVMNWMAAFVNSHDYPKAHDQLFDFAFAFQLTLNEHRNEEIKREFPQADLVLLTTQCRDKFSKYATLSRYESQTEDRIDFCVQHNVPIPGVIPTMEEADAILRGSNLEEQFRTIQLLALMGNRPKKIEGALVGMFSKRSLEDRGRLAEVQVLTIVVLGNTGTSDSRAIDFMISTLPNYGNDTEASKEALVKIGKPAVAPLIKRLEKTTEMDGGLQYQLITLLGKIGKDASTAEKSIRKVLNESRNNDVRYAAEAALLSIR